MVASKSRKRRINLLANEEERMYQMRTEGASFQDIGSAFGVTRQGAHQSVHRYACEQGLPVPKPTVLLRTKPLNWALTREQARAIRAEYLENPSLTALARRHSLTTMTIWRIVTNRTYKDA